MSALGGSADGIGILLGGVPSDLCPGESGEGVGKTVVGLLHMGQWNMVKQDVGEDPGQCVLLASEYMQRRSEISLWARVTRCIISFLQALKAAFWPSIQPGLSCSTRDATRFVRLLQT